VARQLKVLISGRDKKALEDVAGVINSRELEMSVRHINNGHPDPLYGIQEEPELLVFVMGEAGEDELQCLVNRPAAARPATLVLGPGGNTKFMRLAIKAGARDYLELPMDPAELIEAVDRVRREVLQKTVRCDGSLIAVVSAKGGAGASFLAMNLAHMMAENSKLHVALLDLDLQFGSLAQYMDLRPQHGLMKALDMAEHLDAVAADAYMAKHKSGVSLLGPLQDEIILSRDIPVDRFGRLLDLLKENYDRTVADLPRQIDEMSAAVYERADKILLVVQQELANVRDASRLRTLLMRELAVPSDRITMVVNRYEKSLPVELADICKSVGVEKDELVTVPNHYKNVAESINVGVPMLEHARGSSVTKALMSLEHQLGDGREQERRGLFSRTFTNLMGG
jgi:pilus assembly protein CpaE